MNVEVFYLHVVAKADPNAVDPDYYQPYAMRFAETYERFNPGIPHRLTIISGGGPLDDFGKRLFGSQHLIEYDGRGWDCGAHQFAASKSKADFVLCLGTTCYFWRDYWLAKIVEAFQLHGPGLYGAMASYERRPHIRSTAYGCPPELIRNYPHSIDSRRDCEDFESGLWHPSKCFTTWALYNNYPAWMVRTDGQSLSPWQWRNGENIFRRGDQSNCLIWDRHVDVYAKAGQSEKRVLERAADNLIL